MPYSVLLPAVLMGFLGSFHCIGMCGPLALALPIQQNTFWSKINGTILYNTGRIITYSTLGFLFGVIGSSVSYFGWQQWLSICMGVVIILYVIIMHGSSGYAIQTKVQHFQIIRTLLGKLMSSSNNASLLLIGLLNGLLPCGLVYMAAATSLTSRHIISGVLFMAFFGLGTFPAMALVTFYGSKLNYSIRMHIRKAYPVIMLIVGSILIVRGLGLGIPYLSPEIKTSSGEVSCCHSPSTVKVSAVR